MENCCDFLSWLGLDVSMKIFMYLDNPSDFVRVSCVSKDWREFVIANGFCKKLCLRMFPEISSVKHVTEVNNMMEPTEVGSNNYMERESLKRDHRVYAFLARGLTSFMRKNCISAAISASSTDRPEESIENTLEPNGPVGQRTLYWSSKGESDPEVLETLTYKLISKLCVITEINIHPFQAFFQFGYPIYSAKAVRFRMGHIKAPLKARSNPLDEFSAGQRSADNSFIFTYVSPEFPMDQENCLQNFKLPEPVLCIGGILQIELLGRVQRQQSDGLFYICVSHVEVVGWPLLPAFDVEVHDRTGECILKYYPEYCMSPARSSEDELNVPSGLRSFAAKLRQRRVRGGSI